MERCPADHSAKKSDSRFPMLLNHGRERSSSKALKLPVSSTRFSFVPIPAVLGGRSHARSRSLTTRQPQCMRDELSRETRKFVKDGPDTSIDVRSVNYFISRVCNYSCKFCFHTQKTSHHLPLESAIRGIRELHGAGTEKINFAGGEPFLHPEFLGKLCRETHELGMAVSIISNGSLITRKWMDTYGEYVDILGVSIDSFNSETNVSIGRGRENDNKHVDRALKVRDLCERHSILFKMNTVVCSLNWREDMIENVKRLDPYRWKVFQVLILNEENAGGEGDLRDSRNLVVTDRQFWEFIFRHNMFPQLVPEPNKVMRDSYLLLDEDMRFLDCSTGAKIPRKSILDVGVDEAVKQSRFDSEMFEERGGVYEWKRQRK